MSVITTADKKIEEVIEHLHQVAKLLSDIVIDECNGHDEFNKEYTENLFEIMVTSKKFKDKL